MSGRWHAWVQAARGARDNPSVAQLERVHDWCHPTRADALVALRRDLERELKAVQERAAEIGRALVNLQELERTP